MLVMQMSSISLYLPLSSSSFLPQGGGLEGAQFPSLWKGIGRIPFIVSLTVLVDFDKCNGHENGILLF